MLDLAIQQDCSNRLSNRSATMPRLVAGAYYMYSRGELAEALIDSWIVVEQVIDSLWQAHVASVEGKARKDRLSDTRNYTASVRAEVLFSVGKIAPDLYELIDGARKHRNALAHRATITMSAADASLGAMKAAVELACGKTVEPPHLKH